MTSTIKKKDDFVFEITVELGRDDLLKYITETEQKLSKEIKLDGFRHGKIPVDVLRKKIGQDAIRQEALDLAIRKSIAEVISKEAIEVVEQKDLKIKENTAEKLVYSVIFVVIPNFEIGNYQDVKIEKKNVEITPAEEQNMISQILNSRASLRQVMRKVQKGDRVEMDYEITENEKLMPHGKTERHPIIVGEAGLIPGFEDQLIGMATGENKKFLLDVSEDYYNKDFAGKKIKISVTIRNLQERVLPELTDEFAKSVGNFKSANDLMDSIRKGLLAEKQEKEKNREKVEILTQLAEKSQIKIPDEMIQNQLQDMIYSFEKELEEKDMELSFYLAHLKKTQDDLKKEWRSQAEKQVAIQLVSRKIIQKEKIAVDTLDLETEFQNVLKKYRTIAGSEEIKSLDTDSIKNQVHNRMVIDKVFEFLEKKVLLR